MYNYMAFFFHSCTVHLDIIKVFFYFHQQMHCIFVFFINVVFRVFFYCVVEA
jgi:hypothetical protein